MNRLILLVESRIRGDVYVRFGGELPKTHRSNTAGRWMLSLPMYGRIESGWEIENEIIRYTFNIPGNTSALLYLPASSVKDVKENGKGILKKSTGIKFIGENNGKVILELESGSYQFEVKK